MRAKPSCASKAFPTLTALAFIQRASSVFWGSMAYTLIGGTVGGTVLIIVFLPALYAIGFRVKASADGAAAAGAP